jgi:lysozyme
MKIGKKGLDLIKSFEGLKLNPYLDSVNIPTIGFGTIRYPNGKAVSMSDPAITEEKALFFLEHEINEKTSAINKMLKVSVNQNQFDALVSFAYNVGVGALQKSTLLKLLNSGDYAAAAEQFLRWNKAGGKELAGLTRRRQAERSLFLQPINNSLFDEPSEEEINKKLADIEKELE